MGAILTIIALMITAAGFVGAGVAMYLHQKLRQQQAAEATSSYLNFLRRRVSRLLLTLEPLLQGDSPQDTVLYQRFQAHGGEFFDDMAADVAADLRLSQAAWHDAFDLYQKLAAPDAKKERSLPQQIHDWEMLYATLVGYHGHKLSASDLQTLFNPLLNIKPSAQDNAQLTTQLDELRREWTERPLSVSWQQLKPSEIDEQGILGRIEQVKTHITRLPAQHQAEASRQLQQLAARRQTLEVTG